MCPSPHVTDTRVPAARRRWCVLLLVLLVVFGGGADSSVGAERTVASSSAESCCDEPGPEARTAELDASGVASGPRTRAVGPGRPAPRVAPEPARPEQPVRPAVDTAAGGLVGCPVLRC